ncbi:hypothetical protein Tco_1110426 [Tanacetum coccineum]|uniref:Uncharacterized protein n=1 Tax=Tanacetum coccineum TaxID=301880 RepID=A0ABQ5IL70_9ASTR
MSDSKDSTVTYTAVSNPFEDGSDIGSPGVDGPPIMPEDPYAYIMAAYQLHTPKEDEAYSGRGAATTCCCLTHYRFTRYVPESDPEEEPEEDDEDPEEDPADYHADRMMHEDG